MHAMHFFLRSRGSAHPGCIRGGLRFRSTAIRIFKRGSAQPGCILGGLRFRSTAIRFFKIVWCFRISIASFARVFPKKRLELKSLKGQTKAEELGAPCTL